MVLASNLDVFNLTGTYYINYNSTGVDLYQTNTAFPFFIVLDEKIKPESVGTLLSNKPEEYPLWNTILNVVDYWSSVVGSTSASMCTEPPFIPTYNNDLELQVRVNPLINNQHNGISIYMGGVESVKQTLGQVVVDLVRTRSIDNVTPSYLLPYHSSLYFNLTKLQEVCSEKPYISVNKKDYFRLPLEVNIGNKYIKDNLWYLIAHEMCHALGFGTLWYTRNLKGKLLRSFVVGAGDTSQNPHKQQELNLFYSTNSHFDNSRDAQHDLLTFIEGEVVKVGDATFTDAYNIRHSKGTFHSTAVANYNKLFNTSVSAIPIENGGNISSMGTHWDEGAAFSLEREIYGNDGRRYYDSPVPGLGDEIMTSVVEVFRKSPISIITLGALQDLGYIVNFNKAEEYTPLTFNIFSNTTKTIYPTVQAYGNTNKTLVYNPTLSTLQMGDVMYDWVNSDEANQEVIPINVPPNGYRNLADPRNIPLVCRRGITYTFNCYGTVTSQQKMLAIVIAREIKLAQDSTRIFDIVTDDGNVVVEPTILAKGFCTIKFTPPKSTDYSSMLWLRVGVKIDKAKLNTKQYHSDKHNFKFIKVAPIYIYG